MKTSIIREEGKPTRILLEVDITEFQSLLATQLCAQKAHPLLLTACVQVAFYPELTQELCKLLNEPDPFGDKYPITHEFFKVHKQLTEKDFSPDPCEHQTNPRS